MHKQLYNTAKESNLNLTIKNRTDTLIEYSGSSDRTEPDNVLVLIQLTFVSHDKLTNIRTRCCEFSKIIG